MSGRKVYPVDTLAMNRLLWQHKSDLAGIIIRLTWKVGLKRNEIHTLKWDQISFADDAVRLDSRSVPVDEDTIATLQRWREVLNEKGIPLEYVVTSLRTKEQLDPALITNTAQRAMRKAEIEKLRLEDLRCDFIRRMRAEHGDAYAMRVSGMNLRSYSAMLGLPLDEIAAASAEGSDYNERLWNVLQQNRTGASGLALWLSQQAGLTGREIIALTWDDVDLDKGIISVGSETRYLLKEVITMLRREKESRAAADDPHVLLSPTAKAPMSEAALSAMLRDLLIKNGMGDIRAGEIQSRNTVRRDLAQIRRIVEANGFISVADVALGLGVSKKVAYSRLRRLIDSGELVRSGRGYVPKDRFIPQERWADVVLESVERDGHITIVKAADMLHVSRSAAKLLFADMTAQGMLAAASRRGGYVKANKVIKS